MSLTDIASPRVYTVDAHTPPSFHFDDTAVVEVDDVPVSPAGTGSNSTRRVTALCGCAVTILRATRRWLPASYEWSAETTCDNHSRAAIRAAVWKFLAEVRDAR